MKKYTLLAALAFSALTVTATPKENTSQGNPQEMDKFITELMGKMTLHEKIGQLNLPVTGNIVTGQAKSSDNNSIMICNTPYTPFFLNAKSNTAIFISVTIYLIIILFILVYDNKPHIPFV